ncbi:UDP-glycosyltransferase 72B1-like [Dioscorea cayenensis subsp. rotundata]|uniref:Glycosyltransferase n=1 Tax=Dioscorea cayennensis subsp. rotundata TaxID=55577 RepID=A0AB40CUR0_DIOCR|nr:UDP-glycosyltransferase 72B1-like [Dioscorea cayenensis subsp. rotundata]
MAAQVAILSGPGIGHLFPCSELARRLVRHHNLSVSLITQSLGPPSDTELSLISSIREEINVVSIPPPPPHSIPQNKNLIFLLLFLSAHNGPHLHTILNSLTANTSTPPLKALLVDMFCDEATLDITQELGVRHYMFFTSGCILLSFALHLTKLDETYDGEYTDILEPIRLPGYSQSFYGKDFPQPVVERKNEVYTSYLSLSKLYYKTRGILVNSTEELEPELINFMKEDERIPPVYPIGPLIRSCSRDRGSDATDDQCLRWLEEQPNRTVLYVSFGSGGTLTREQMKELAWGLELSKQRFLWVVKRPNDEADASYFGGEINVSSFNFLPNGFLDRTKGLGLVVFAWAPQLQMLGHAAIGGFLTHCGWNSILESISNGVPMIAWPLFAEQKMNAVMLEEDVKVAVRAKVDDTGLVRKEEIVRLIKCLMEDEQGRKMRDRVSLIGLKAAHSVEEGGSSFRSMKAVVSEWINL